MARPRKKTATSPFGVSGRVSHDSTRFYERFAQPVWSGDKTVNPPAEVDILVCGDARHMDRVADNSVALVVTSPPYYAAKEYEDVARGAAAPGDYTAYLDMVRDVMAACYRKLEPGGRVALNLANIGRKPFRPLTSDGWRILEEVGFIPRGEHVWIKGEGASGSCAWGSFCSPSNPVMRDLTERILVASKGRMGRVPSAKERAEAGLPHRPTISKADFMAWTLDVWRIRPASAKRVGHPAPFPVELPHRLIQLHTWEGDLVLDPFMGAGTTAVAAVEDGRHFVGYDLDQTYLDTAAERVAAAQSDEQQGAA